VRKFGAAIVLLLLAGLPLAAQVFPLPNPAKRRPDLGPSPKNIHGYVQDVQGKGIPGAKVFVKDLKTQVVRTLNTDPTGKYEIFALTPTEDYEVHAEYSGKKSESRMVSGFVNRQDNVINFQLEVTAGDAAPTSNETRGPEFTTFDLVRLHASLDVPSGVSAPIPTVLLLHGFGENRAVWEPLKKQLLEHGWAVVALDLRGHGESKTKDGAPIEAAASWRTDPNQFPQDIDPALDFIKAQTRLNNRKIAVIGVDVGADLALIASGRYPEVRTVVAIDPKLSESLALAGSSQDFAPRSALVISADPSEASKFKPLLKQPYKFESPEIHGGTAAWIGTSSVTDAIFEWLQKTF
jgi:pimeloyl-ACP methyl ester carboxylesterase